MSNTEDIPDSLRFSSYKNAWGRCVWAPAHMRAKAIEAALDMREQIALSNNKVKAHDIKIQIEEERFEIFVWLFVEDEDGRRTFYDNTPGYRFALEAWAGAWQADICFGERMDRGEPNS
jgi:hypothetical protein